MVTFIEANIKNVISLDEYLTLASHDLSYGQSINSIIVHIAESTKKIAALLRKGALVDVGKNLAFSYIQGEVQTNIAGLSNDLLIAELKDCGLVCGLISKELEAPLRFPEAEKSGQFLVAFNPLDVSSNLNVNVSAGSIFSILMAPKKQNIHDAFLQLGNQQLAAAYVLYGPSTILVLTIGYGTQGFTLCPELQTFVLTHPDMQISKTAYEYAIHTSNERYWEEPVQQYIYECIDGKEGKRGRDFNMRWVASMVTDVHRILMRGGVYLYPADNKLPNEADQLRLLCEANPISYIVEQAGGRCTTGRQRILDIQPTEIHQRTPVILGSSNEVSLLELYHSEFDSKLANALLLEHMELG